MSDEQVTQRTGARTPSTLLLAITLALTALNLRAAVTSVGPVLREIQASLGMSDTVAGVLTTLPVISFGIVGLFAARLGRRIGTDTALMISLALIVVGLSVRAAAPTTGLLLITSLLALAGMAVGNILLPVVVRAWFPDKIGTYTGVYSVALMLGTAAPTAITFPIADAVGSWRFALGLWAIPALIALIPWFFVRSRQPETVVEPAVRGPSSMASRIRRSPVAWGLMIFFGAQSLEAYVAMGWLPAILQDAGISSTASGWLASFTLVLSVPVAMAIPPLASRRPDQRPFIVMIVACSVAAYLGLLFAPSTAPVLWVFLLGIGLGAFPLALAMIGLRSSTAAGTAELSGFVQGAGYIFAATGPISIGLLHDLSGDWKLPLVALLVILIPKLIGGLIAGVPGVVDAEQTPAP